MEQDAWLSKGAKILSEVKEWRKAHPKATFVAIEEEVHRRMVELEAQLLQDTAQESASRSWGREAGGAIPKCPTCPVSLYARGQQARTLQGNGGASVTFQRTYGTCPAVGRVFSPSMRNWLYFPALWPRANKGTSCNWPVGCRFAMPAKCWPICWESMSARRRLVGCAKKSAAESRTSKLLKRICCGRKRQTSERTPVAWPRVADGAMAPLIGGAWAEVRTLAIGEVPADPADLEQFHVRNLSYFSRLTDAIHFIDLAEAETRRRKLVQAKEVCAVMDGADWLQTFVDIHRPDALRILDFPHAVEHLSQLVEALRASGHVFPPCRMTRKDGSCSI